MSMKLRKNLGRLATAFVATAMLASLSAVPASAAGEDVSTPNEPEQSTAGIWGDDEGEITNNTITLSKNLMKRAGVATPNVSFDVYVSTIVTPTEFEVDGIPVQNGRPSSVSFEGTFDFVNSEETVDDTVVASTSTVTATFDMTQFTEPGIYKYTLLDSPVDEDGEYYTYEGMTNDAAYMYVYVEENGVDENTHKMTYKVANVVLTKEVDPNEESGKIGNFTNRYGVDPDGNPDGTVNDLILTKNVEGNQGEYTREFTFVITVDPSEKNNVYRVAVGSYDEDGKWSDDSTATDQYIGADRYSVTVKLKDGQSVRVYGLSANDKYTISEVEANDSGYKTTVKANDVDVTASMIDTDSDNVKDATQDFLAAKTDESGNYDVENAVAFTNTREATTPTGIVMNVAPYALLVVVAAGACFVFLRKRRED